MSHDREELERQFLRSLDEHVRPPLRLEGDGFGAPEGWFLGPKAENEKLLIELIVDAIREHCRYRRNFHPEDPEGISEEEKRSEAYKYAVKTLRGYTGQLLEKLQLSAPFFSMRYQSHMLWDQVLPAMVGYFAAMLYNQNNVAAEASPITTLLEIEVGDDLCRMLGYVQKKVQETGKLILPWGHITCGGTVANIESLWAARNAKFFPLAVAEALRKEAALAKARHLTVKVRRLTEGPLQEDSLDDWHLQVQHPKLLDLDTWTLLNLELDEILDLPYRIAELCEPNARTDDEIKVVLKKLNPAITKHTLQNVGMVEYYRQPAMECIRPPVVFVPSTQHYSWPKGATLLGLGQNCIKKIYVDHQARMDIEMLDRELALCLRNHIPVIAVVAVMGSTAESAVDSLDEILEKRGKYRTLGLEFVLHCDAAWGGYFASMLRTDSPAGRLDESAQNMFIDRAFSRDNAMANAARRSHWFSEALFYFRQQKKYREFPMSPYVAEQYKLLPQADSITVDPHKAGYVPYPAGALCYRNSKMRDLVSLSAPVVFHEGKSEPTVGIYGIEGSKPGAAAAAVWLAHRVIRPTQGGYGRILGQCMWTCTRLYCRLVTMTDPHFKITMLHKLPTIEGRSEEDIKAEIRKHFIHHNNWELLKHLKKHDDAAELFMKLGSDQLILAYSFNFYKEPGNPNSLNTDVTQMNALNNRIFEICSITAPIPDLSSKKLILTNSSFSIDNYGPAFVDEYCCRAGVENPDRQDVPFLISTTMDPWTTDVARTPDTPEGDFLAVIEDALREAVLKAREEVIAAENNAATGRHPGGGGPQPLTGGPTGQSHER